MRRAFLLAVAMTATAIMPWAQGREAMPPGAFSFDKLRIGLDLNADGRLDPAEIKTFSESLAALVKAPHPVVSKLDTAFDRNSDKRIDEAELKAARETFFAAAIKRAADRNPDIVRALFGKDAEMPGPEDLRQLGFFMFDPESRKSHAARTAFEKRFDANKDGALDGKELEEGRTAIFEAVVSMATAIPVRKGLKSGKVKSLLDELADANKDGKVDEVEARQANEALVGPHNVRTPFDKSIDYDGNGRVDPVEIEKALRTASIPAGGEESFAKAPYPAKTAVDGLFDVDGNGSVTEAEIMSVLGPAASGGVPASKRFMNAIDSSGDGVVDRQELKLALAGIFRPHPVAARQKLDKELDANKNGFVEPEEIGIAAGVSAGGRVLSVDERLARARIKGGLEFLAAAPGASPEAAPSEIVKRDAAVTPADGSKPRTPGSPGSGGTSTIGGPPGAASAGASKQVLDQLDLELSGKRLAVVSIADSTKSLEPNDLDGLYIFVQNAFVNAGETKMIERKDLGKVVGEIELSMELGDESTASTLESLRGVDIVVIGSISKVGSKYYLNIRLVTVAGAELVGSSVASAESPDGFYEMCSDAVINLF